MKKRFAIPFIVWLLLGIVSVGSALARAPEPDGFIRTLNIKKMTFRQVASLISQSTNQQVVVSRKAGHIPISVFLCNIEVEDALAAICNAYQCWYKRADATGVISVVTIEEFQSGLSLQTEELVEVVSLRYLDARQMGDTLRSLYRDRVVWERPDDDDSDSLYDLERAIDRMDTLTDSAQISDNNDDDNSRNSSTDRNSRNANRSNRSSRSGTRVLEETQQPRIEREALLSQLQQARARGEEQLRNRPGVVYISAYPHTNDLIIRTADRDTMNNILKTIERVDRIKPQVLIEIKVLEVELQDTDSRGVDWLFQSGSVSGGRSTGLLSPFEGSTGSYGQISAPDDNLVPQGVGLNPNAALLQIVTDDLVARLQLLQDENRLTGLALPNLCVADGEASRVFVGTSTVRLTDIEVTYDETEINGTIIRTPVYDPQTEECDVGMALVITPEIHSARDVTIRIVQEDSQLGDIQEIQYGTDDIFKSQNLESRSVTTTVVGRDGEVSAIGGLIRESKAARDSGVPVLKDIPYLGWFFRTHTTVDIRTEMIVLLRPHILLSPDDSAATTRNMLQRVSGHPHATRDFSSMGVGSGRAGLFPSPVFYQPPNEKKAAP